MAKNPSVSGAGSRRRRGAGFGVMREAFSELRRVTWPTRQETMRLTLMVLAVSIAVGIFLGIVDLAFARIMDLLLGN